MPLSLSKDKANRTLVVPDSSNQISLTIRIVLGARLSITRMAQRLVWLFRDRYRRGAGSCTGATGRQWASTGKMISLGESTTSQWRQGLVEATASY